MGTTSIEWTEKTWNPVRGCSRVSPGCDNCYAMRQAHRHSGAGGSYEGLTTIRRGKVDWMGSARFIPDQLEVPLRRRKPTRWFVNSMADLFHESLSNEEIAAVFGIMAACPQHTFQVLTKRAKRMAEWFEWHSDMTKRDGEPWIPIMREAICWLPEQIGLLLQEDGVARDGVPELEPWPLPNVWLGVSAEDQQRADERIPLLLRCPAALRWVSAEPLLGPIDFRDHDWTTTDWLRGIETLQHAERPGPKLDWIVVGGESGHGARPCDIAWARSIRDQCREAGVAFFLKQLGRRPVDAPTRWLEWRALGASLVEANDHQRHTVILDQKKGNNPDEWPEDLRVREYPEASR